MLGGWKTLSMVQRYSHLSPDHLRSAVGMLDPIATRKIEELMLDLKQHYTIVVVTHNMAQARRVSDECVFMLVGRVIEHNRTEDLFLNPKDSKTADYIEGRYG